MFERKKRINGLNNKYFREKKKDLAKKERGRNRENKTNLH